MGATRQGEVSVGFTKACSSQEDLARDAERWGSGYQVGAWDTPERKFRKCRDLSHQGQVLVTIVTSAAATHECSFCQELC